MDWIRGFYARQDSLAKIYQQPIAEHDRRRAAAVRCSLTAGGNSVLELGCGGGQTAAAIADLGYDIVAVDLNPSAVRHARKLAAVPRPGTLTVLEADFFDLNPAEPFELICYFDGFGTGQDADQRRLLQRICSWLKPGGLALIEVYTPWYWQNMAGRMMQFGQACRRYGYDAGGQRMLDTWWAAGNSGDEVTQSLRCYTPAEFEALAANSGLRLVEITPGGAVDPEQGVFRHSVPLAEAMSYTALLRISGE
jgi:SAM-dependent methyltransferase